MGQKTHPTGFRLGVVQDWKSRWYAERDFPRLLHEDETIRKYLRRRLSHAALSHVEIERKPSKIVVTLHTGRQGVVIGKRGAGLAERVMLGSVADRLCHHSPVPVMVVP